VPKPVPYVFYNKEESEKGGNKELESHYDEKSLGKKSNDYNL